MNITVEEVREEVERIARCAGDDDEAAHSYEDDLREKVLEAIRNGAPNPIELASAALETSKIEFMRWCV